MEDDRIHDRVTRTEESTKSAHRRLDGMDEEIKGLRDAKHDLYARIHNHAGIVVGMQAAVEKLNSSVNSWAEKTDLNTQTLNNGKATLSTAIVAVKIGVAIISILGSAFASFVIFVGGKLLNWW